MPNNTILYYTRLYYTILYYTILYYTLLYYTILYYTILYSSIQYYTIQGGSDKSGIFFLRISGSGSEMKWNDKKKFSQIQYKSFQVKKAKTNNKS